MRSFFLLAISLSIFAKGFSQFQDTYQPSTLYKTNRIRARILMFDYNKHNTKTVDYFDRNGFVVAHIQYDTTGQNILSSSTLKYDSSQKLVSETIFNYLYRYDSTAKNMFLTNVADTLRATITYDSLNRVIKKELRNAAGKINFEVSVTYNPYRRIEKRFSIIDSGYLEINTVYEAPPIEKRTTYSHMYNGQLTTWVDTYKNHFDRDGKIISRSVKREGDPPAIASYMGLYFENEEFQYMKNGLLMNKTSTGLSDNSGRISRQIFDYKFW